MAVNLTIQQLRKTAAQWTSDNTVLAAGLLGFETDTGKYKLGDGTTAWNSLSYPSFGVSGIAWGAITGTLSDQTDLQSALDAKQATLVSGTNIKTINSTSILGSGDITISGGVSDGDKGDITVSASGATWTIDNNAVTTAKIADANVTLAKIENISTSHFIGRHTAGSGAPQQVSATQARTILNVEDGAEVNNISDVNAIDLTDGGDSTLHYHSADRDRANHTGTQLLSTISDVTATAAEVNILDGATLTTTELNYVDGVTSAIQTQINNKYDASNPAGYITGVAWGSITGTLSSQTDLQSALDTKLTANSPITGGTKTKVTYDANGLITSGADATTADIADSLDKRYITDAQQTILGNTSGTNTGDETTSTIKTKLGAASSLQDGYLTSTDWTTFNSKQNTLGFTPENVSNKSTSTSLGTSDTLYPSQNAVKSYVDTGLSGKQNTLVSGTNIKTVNGNTLLGSGDLTVGGGSAKVIKLGGATIVTGTTTNTYSNGILVPANTFKDNDTIEIIIRFNKTTTTNLSQFRGYINTTNDISGTPIQFMIATVSNASRYYRTQRNLEVWAADGTGSGTVVMQPLFASQGDYGAAANQPSSLAIDWTIDQYIVVSCQNNSTGESVEIPFILAYAR